jgi:hypothetical protein
MQPLHTHRQPWSRRQDGIALLIVLMVLMLASVLSAGFVATIIADQRASGLDRDQTQAYAAAHAGLEQITSDLSQLFTTDFSPSATQIAALRANPPVLPGFSYIAPGGTEGSGYWVGPRFPDASGNPLPEDAVNGSVISAGPYQGFRGIITPYDITVTARSRGGAEVRMRRTLQTVAIPVFQFGMFSETDLAFHAGAEAFGFGGRVHTNGNLFLAAADSGSLTIADRITAVKDVVRTHLPNGLATTSGYGGSVRIPTTIASNPANNVYRSMARTEGSLQGTLGSSPNPNWTQISVGTYKTNIRDGDTGAKQLDLPLVADLDNNGAPDAEPIELIRRPAQNSNEHVTNPIVYQQRFFSQASLRILLSDDAADITNLPTVTTAPAPVALFGPLTQDKVLDYGVAPPDTMRSPLGNYETPNLAPSGANYLPADVTKGAHNETVLGGYIKIELQQQNGTWVDVTREILGLGISGRNLADANQSITSRWNNIPDTAQPSPIPVAGTGDICAEPHKDAVIRLQRVRDIPMDLPPCGVDTDVSGDITGNVSRVSQNEHDYWPLALYDTREGQTRDGLSGSTIYLGGIIHYVELDVNNLRRWLAGQIGASGTQAKNDNGYIVYFSDRRLNNDLVGRETGEYGFEDVTNPTTAGGAPNSQLNPGEDLNGNGTLETYGASPWAPLLPTGALAPFLATASPTTAVPATNAALVARANRHVLFRRALKLVNGQLGSLPPGLTVVSENPIYVQGNFNASGTSFNTTTHVPAALIADAVTFLSNNWNDIRSFTAPSDSLARPATGTIYRMALITGKGLAFPQPSGTDASFGSDGGAHNFMRSLENWDTTGTIHRYRGSMVSFFINRQGVGTFKCCDQDAYNRGDRAWSFDTDFLLPSKLPPGTPMFRDVNTLTFRQLLRPTQ